MADIIRNDLTFKTLEKALDGLSLRQQAISNNVANVDTPNFKSTEVSFEDDLQSALKKRPAGDELALRVSDARHVGGDTSTVMSAMDAVQPRAKQMLGTTLRNDGNNVDIDREMTRLAESQIFFQAGTQLLNMKFNQLKTAIWEGKK